MGAWAEPESAWAHPARTSALLLDRGEHAIGLELQLPVDELGLALDAPAAAGEPRVYLREHESALRDYVRGHLGATTRDGRPFRLEVRAMTIERVDGADALVVRAVLDPPEAASSASFRLHGDAILHRVVTHETFVSVRRDFENAVLPDNPELVGVLAYGRASIDIDRAQGSWWLGFEAVVGLGMRHIAEGADHLLFLLLLLLPAPLTVERKRWSEPAPAAQSLRQVIAIVTAFTVGHSITLAIAALGILRLPSRPVEILIAVSILVSAMHAVRPWMHGRAPLVAASFGLVHGLAFATVLGELGFQGRALALSLLAFNVGIEAMQLLVVAAVMPSLMVLARSPSYGLFRVGSAILGAIAAAGWIAEQGSGDKNLVSGTVERAVAHAELGVALLNIAAAFEVTRRWGRSLPS